MLNYKEFVSKDKSIVIAPAGYGKTHTISESILHTEGKQLILTHTHAGVASIKEKLKKLGVYTASYNVETITSYAQKYVKSFCPKKDTPSQDIPKEYYPYIIKEATRLIRIKPISDVLTNSYTGLFVDEYQDCTLIQHDFIIAISNLIPTRLLGDYLQGIFDFTGELIDLEDESTFKKFNVNRYELTTPWRWKDKNVNLGNDLKEIREKLINCKEVKLNTFSSIEFVKINQQYFKDRRSIFYTKIWSLYEEESLLIIHPDSTNINSRLKFIQTFKNKFRLLESIDDKIFYSISKEIDQSSPEHIPILVRSICLKVFNKTAVNNWFNDKGLKNKTKLNDKDLIKPIKLLLEEVSENNSMNFKLISKLLEDISKLPKFICYRKELFKSICLSLKKASKEKISVHEAMQDSRNMIRMVGRKIHGKCIGTTLLTKGLEFDTVCILHAEKFTCPKNLYVALTRASKRLIIISQKNTLKI